MYRAEVTYPGKPSLYVLGLQLEALCEANARWYLDELAAGRKPACCAKCAGAVYKPDSITVRWRGGSEICAHPNAGYSCHEIAAWDAGVKRAKAVLEGTPPDEARAAYRCEFVPGKNGPHAVVLTPEGMVDGTKTMRRAA